MSIPKHDVEGQLAYDLDMETRTSIAKQAEYILQKYQLFLEKRDGIKSTVPVLRDEDRVVDDGEEV